MEDRLYDFWLAGIQDGYIGKLTEIAEAAGSAKVLYYMKDSDLKGRLKLSDRLTNYIMSMKVSEDSIKRDYEDMQRKGISFVTYYDDSYPERLQNISSKPYGLFVKGSLPEEEVKSVAIIGARECSEYGRLMAEYFGDRLARQNINIISGMAWGIDGIAQMAAVQAKGRSFGVLGCGVDIAYPQKNRRLYEMLLENGSGVISEYAPGTKAVARHFPPRNRIISGLCDLLIVVEAKSRSGTLITVDMAVEQGKTIMVVPGRVTDALSLGCLNLMYDGALPAISVESVLEQLGSIAINKPVYIKENDREKNNNKRTDNKKADYSIDGNKKKLPEGEKGEILSYIGLDPISIDDISLKSGLDISRLMVILTELEMEGYVKEIGQMNFACCNIFR